MKARDLLDPVKEELRRHAKACYPNEAVGVILSSGYRALENIAEDPSRFARIRDEELSELEASGELLAIFHSHPDGPNCPSAADMKAQLAMDVPFVIISTNGDACLEPFAWGDQIEPPPLLDRGFQHGVTDCYAAIRDWWRVERGERLPEFPRDWEWWSSGARLYEDGLAEAGFVLIEKDLSLLQPGDGVLMSIRSPTTPNHAGVYVGNGLLFHHATSKLAWDPSRLSREEPVGRWEQHITHLVRRTKFEDHSPPRTPGQALWEDSPS